MLCKLQHLELCEPVVKRNKPLCSYSWAIDSCLSSFKSKKKGSCLMTRNVVRNAVIAIPPACGFIKRGTTFKCNTSFFFFILRFPLTESRLIGAPSQRKISCLYLWSGFWKPATKRSPHPYCDNLFDAKVRRTKIIRSLFASLTCDKCLPKSFLETYANEKEPGSVQDVFVR